MGLTVKNAAKQPDESKEKTSSVWERITASNTYQESISLINSFVLLSFDKSLIWVVIDTLIVWILILLHARLLLILAPSFWCMLKCQDDLKSCCMGTMALFLQLLSFSLPLLLGSLISTKMTKNNRLRHSACLSTLMLFSTAAIQMYFGVPLLLIGALAIIFFFIIFWGYKLAYLI